MIIASSSQTSIEKAYHALAPDMDLSSDTQILSHRKCDVLNAADLKALFKFASETFTNNKIDIIINNFGTDSAKRDFLWNISCEDIQE